MKEWNAFDRFETVIDKYMPLTGEGETVASQIVTAVNKLIYKWYNDGDVFDNTYAMEGWCNDLSSYANWLYAHTDDETNEILDGIERCMDDGDYEDLLYELAKHLLNEDYLERVSNMCKAGSIYKCDGAFKFVEQQNE